MLRSRLIPMLVIVSLCGITTAFAEPATPLAIKQGDTIQKLLERQKGKRVTLRLQGGEELTGKVIAITKELVHLEELMRREYFDAVVEIDKVEALIVRTKE